MTQLGSSHIYSGLDDDMMIDEQMMDPEDGEDDEEIRKMRREMKNGVLDQQDVQYDAKYDVKQFEMPEQ